MGAAATEILSKRCFDLVISWLLVGGEKGRRLHDHAVDAVTALRSLFVDERFLHRMQFLRRAEALQRYHLLLGVQRRQRRYARTNRLAIDMDGASAALPEPTAKSGAV